MMRLWSADSSTHSLDRASWSRHNQSAGPSLDCLSEWLVDEYEQALPEIKWWSERERPATRLEPFLRTSNHDHIQLLVDPSLVEETWNGRDAPSTAPSASTHSPLMIELPYSSELSSLDVRMFNALATLQISSDFETDYQLNKLRLFKFLRSMYACTFLQLAHPLFLRVRSVYD
eukprot:m.353126 g.353126  ORF g.353126 m.353126 type:complete len:174 (+) comp16588_c4_seq2:977-1498(+)